MTLMLDIGNTTIAWLWVDQKGVFSSIYRANHGDYSKLTQQLGLYQWEAAYIANVSGCECLAACVELLKDRPIYLCKASRRCGELRNGYKDYQALGVDRWLGMVGVWQKNGAKGPFYLIDVGTTTTIDYVDEVSQHQGGFILPSHTAYLGAIFTKTTLSPSGHILEKTDLLGFGRTTGQGINGGYFQLISTCLKLGDMSAPIYLSGGNLETIKAILPTDRLIELPIALFLGMQHRGVRWQKY